MTEKTNSGLPAPFENTYFRERAFKAANLLEPEFSFFP
jgi:hypothetical protein